MQLHVLSSNSAANGYLLNGGRETLLIECGCKWQEVQRALDFDISRIVGALVSHEHGDHARYARQALEAHVPVYTSQGTAQALHLDRHPLLNVLKPLQSRRVGAFTIRPFPVQHDAAEPMGFLVHHPEMGTMLFATDTYYLKYTFKGLSHILLECNYRKDILEKNVESGHIHPAQRDRTLRSHMSYETCRDALLANDLSLVRHIVLLHLSDGNSHAEDFQKGIAETTRKEVHIAEQGLKIEINKTPF